MKIVLIDDRGIWLDGEAREKGYEATVDPTVGEALVEAGLASELSKKQSTPKTE
jgi:hypothetical protein